MATPSTTYFTPTGDRVVDLMTNGYRWVLQSDRGIDFAVANGFHGEYWNSISSVAGHLKFATDLVSYYANIKFNDLGTYTMDQRSRCLLTDRINFLVPITSGPLDSFQIQVITASIKVRPAICFLT